MILSISRARVFLDYNLILCVQVGTGPLGTVEIDLMQPLDANASPKAMRVRLCVCVCVCVRARACLRVCVWVYLGVGVGVGVGVLKYVLE